MPVLRGYKAIGFSLLDTAQLKSRATVRVFLRHPLRDVFLVFSVEVVAQLVAQFLVRPLPVTRSQRATEPSRIFEMSST